MRAMARRVLWIAAAFAAAGCVVDNPAPGLDAGTDGGTGTDGDTDADADTDTDADADGGGDAGTTLACDENGDICEYAGDGDPIGVVEDCPDQNSVCTETDGGVPECSCVEHFDLATDCTGCTQGFGGGACAVCEIGYGGDACGDCVGAYVYAGGACVYGGLCGSDGLWLHAGELPGTARPDEEFAVGGTTAEVTTVDLVTGLEWQRCPTGTVADGPNCIGGFPESVANASAAAHCLAPFGGYADWRLPEASEIQSLFDYEAADHVNAEHFMGYVTELWSSTDVPGSSSQHYAVRYADFSAAPPADDMAFGVCVRDVEAPSSVTPHFAIGAADGSTAVDLWAEREWRRCMDGQTWGATGCEGDPIPFDPYGADPPACGDGYAGHFDWRVPDASEMSSLLAWCDESRLYFIEAFATSLVPYLEEDTYWTSTFDPESLDFYAFDLSDRGPALWSHPEPLPVLCVRDPG